MDPTSANLISDQLSHDESVEIAKAFWGEDSTLTFHLKHDVHTPSNPVLESYFRYYFKQCDLIALHDNGAFSSLKTHHDVSAVALILLNAPGRDEAMVQLSQLLKDGTKSQHENSIYLVSRLITMIRIGDVPHEFLGGKCIDWKSGSLRDFVHGYFSARPVLGHDGIKFEKQFNALSLQNIAGLEIRWTDNLADHLRLMNYDSVLCVFHHATFLKYQKSNVIFPQGFIDETLNSLALLFPKYDKKVTKWAGTQSEKYGLDPTIVDISHLIADERQIETFRYWHDRLVVLKQVYDESRPNSISQWWYDRRNGVQWYTFWVAIVVLVLTIFFGLVQSIEGALQVYKAYYPS